jgi:hypothetical protein
LATNEKPTSSKPSKMTVMLFQLEGSDDTLQEGFRIINNAIDKLANPVVRVIASGNRALPAAKNGDENAAPVLEAEVVDEEEVLEEQPIERPKTSRSATAPRQPEVLELDLKTGAKPLRQYLEEKNPTSDNRKYLLIAAWMKDNLKLDEISIDHIYTAYRHMGWTSQRDVGAPLRSMKSQNGWFAKGKSKGTYAINHIGINVAERTNGE